LANLGGFLLGMLGSVVGGLVLDASGTSGAFVFAGVVSGVAAAFLWRRPPVVAVDPNARRSTPAFREALTLVFRNRTVALIALLVIVAEILGFSCTALFPTSREIFSDPMPRVLACWWRPDMQARSPRSWLSPVRAHT
jgi:hypothetical protein